VTCPSPAPAPEPVLCDRARAEALVHRYGRAPLDYFKLWPDKSYFFSADLASMIAYGTAWSVAVSLGDPIGPAPELPALVESFAGFCARRHTRAAFYQVGPHLIATYRQQGLHLLKIGEEAMVDLERFAIRTSRQRPFSRPRRRLVAEGYRVTYQRPPHAAGVLDEAEEVSRDWLSLPGRREHGFMLGRFDREYLTWHPLVVVRDPSGRLVGFLNEVPGVRPGVATIDLMRHRRDAPNALMDYLFSELMLRVYQHGYRWFSLGLAPLAGTGEGDGAGWPERLAHEVFEHASAVFSFKGLRAFKAKFEPEWKERYLAYQGGRLGLLRTALALGRLTRA